MAARKLGTLAALVALMILVACALSYPLGMTESEWNRLTPQEQLAARQHQADLNAEAARLRAEEQERQRQAEEDEQQRIDDLYRYGRRGDLIHCDITSGEDGVIDFRPGWQVFETIRFTLARGEAQSLGVDSAVGDKSTAIWGEYDITGDDLRICESSGQNCATVAVYRRDFQRGYEDENFEISGKLKRATLYCSY